MHHHDHDSSKAIDGRWQWVLIGFLAVAGFFLWTEHRAHLLGWWPYLLVLACPLMHLFHHGHGHGAHQHGQQPPEASSRESNSGAHS
ncbi:MAG: DUF2933 domain-containing protein [Ramlibacter sp.]